MIKLRSLGLTAALALVGSVLFSTAASACESDCRCSDGSRHHQRHHAMMEGHHHMHHHAMRGEWSERRRLADGNDERGVFFMRFRREGGPHERFDTWYGPHPHHLMMMRGGEGCEHGEGFGRMRMAGPPGWSERGDFPPPPPPGMAEWREHRHHHFHHRDCDGDHHRRGFDPYRDNWDSRDEH